MSTKQRILSVVLSILMVAVLFAPMHVFATDANLLIVIAEDNGGTSAITRATEAIDNLYTNTPRYWYSGDRNVSNPAIATFTLRSQATVSAVSIAFYKSTERIFTFSVEYSNDKVNWATALPSTTSAQQAAEKDAETFTFPEPVSAQYLRVVGTATTVVKTGASNNYTAYYTFNAIGTFTTETLAPANYTAVDAALAKFADFQASDYTPESWAAYTTARDNVMRDKNYTEQAIVDGYATALNTAFANLVSNTNITIIDARLLEGFTGVGRDDVLPRAAVPNLKQPGDNWCAVGKDNSNDDSRVQLVFVLEREALIDSVSITWYNGHQRNYNFAIYTSLDDETYTEVRAMGPSEAAASATAPSVYTFETPVDATYIKIVGNGCSLESVKGYTAFTLITVDGHLKPGGAEPVGSYSVVRNWMRVFTDLTEEMYTAESWAVYTDICDAIDWTISYSDQATIDAYVADLEAAYEGLVFTNLEELQIAQSYWTGGPKEAWTNGAVLFTESGTSLGDYVVYTNEAQTSSLNLQYWTRITAAPVEGLENVYDIINIKGTLDNTSVPVTADEIIPDGGFIFAFHLNNGSPVGSGSQYASQEFGNRNAAAFAAMGLTIGDRVQLNNVTDPMSIGDDPGAAYLDTTGTWRHTYSAYNAVGVMTPTPIYRTSGTTNKAEGLLATDPQFLARDQFDGFTTASTITKYEGSSILYGDCDENGELTVDDLTLLAKSLAGWDVVINVNVADCDVNGELTVDDLTLFAKFLAGWDVTLG